MKPYARTIDDVLKEKASNQDVGLSSGEAEKRLQHYGKNQLARKKSRGIFVRFLLQFKDVMVIILLIAAAVSLLVHLHDKEGLFEPFLIIGIVTLNAIIGVVQEGKAEKALASLKNLATPHARVKRNGTLQEQPATLLVPGDIITVEAGNLVPADARLIHSARLQVNESALTGESVPAEKDAEAIVDGSAPLGDRRTMIYSGCSVTYGRGTAVVVATGMATEIGTIAGLLANEPDASTPLQQKLALLGRYLGGVALLACAIIFVIGLLEGRSVIDIFMIAVSLAVSAIPEGLPAIVTIVLAIGVRRMVKKNAIIRKLPAVETLGSASVICSDKTGTLTQNRMTVTRVIGVGGEDETVTAKNSAAIRRILQYATLCSDGTIEQHNGTVTYLGDPTETSIVYAAQLNGMEKSVLETASPRLRELPFDSERKLMSTVHTIQGKTVMITKGSFDSLKLHSCNTRDEVNRLQKMVNEMGESALRVLAVGYRELSQVPQEITESDETNITILGLIGMIDPPRDEAKKAVALCRQAGIKPVMITGDHIVTAMAIAKALDIMRPNDRALSGAELDEMSDEGLQESVKTIAVYARVSPEDKIRIVKAWQKTGAIVAMTGDGVNDAPALKAADIGCAMGVTGTDVAKSAADMTLTDDNFATIVTAVREGRGIYANITKVVRFLLGTNVGEIITVFLAMVLWRQTPLLAAQLLWINLVTDSLPAISLGLEPVESTVMRQKPKPKNQSLFAGGLWQKIIIAGLLFAGLTLLSFWLGWRLFDGVGAGQTMAFITLAFVQLVQAFNVRSDRSLFSIGVLTNKYLLGSFVLSTVLMLMVMFVSPMAIVFGLVPLPTAGYGIAFGLAVVPFLLSEVQKLIWGKSLF